MRIHDDLDLLGRQPGGPTKQKEASPEVGHALANPKQASVQTMLEVQRLAGNAGVSSLLQRDEEGGGGARSPVLDVIGKGGGQPLDGGLRGEMEGRLGADFSDVKVHTDSKASDSARAVQANAYTVGNEIVMRQDRWSPSTSSGKETIAHELTHVMQQRAGPVAGTPQGDGVSVSDPSDRFERAAETTAKAAMSDSAAAGGAGAVSAQMQREAMPEEEEPVQTQREAMPEEEEPVQTQREAEDELTEEGGPAMQAQRQSEDLEEEAPAG